MAEKRLMVIVGGHAKEFEKMMSGVQKKMERTGRDMRKIGGGLTSAVTLPIAAVGGAAIKSFADFEQAMTSSTAIMGDLSAEMENKMSDAARDVAKTTRFSAEEAAESYFYLASAGMDAQTAVEALPKVAQFAQAGNFDMARATDLLTDAQSALGMTVDDVTENMQNQDRVSDTLVEANRLANASVEEFAESLTNKGAASLELMNKDVEEGVAMLAVFADQGLKGSEAGTILARTLDGVAEQGRKNAEDFERLGVEVFDADGEMHNMADIVGDLEKAFDGMSTEQREAELASLGFNERTRRGILTLMDNSDALRDYEGDLRNAAGTTEEVANKQLDNLWDQLGLVKDQLIDVAIELGSTLVPIIKDSVLPVIERFGDFLGRLAEWFGDLDPVWQKVIIAAAGFLAILGPIIMIVGTLISSIAAILPVFAALLSPIGLVIAAIVALIAVGVLIWKNWDTIKEKAIEIWGAIKDFFSGAWESIKEIFSNALQAVWDFFLEYHPLGMIISHWDEIKEFFSNVWESIKEIFSGATSGIFDGIKERFNAVKDWLVNIWETVRDWFAGIWDSISGVFDMSLSDIWETIKGWFWAYQDFITGLMGSIEDIIGELWDSAKDKVLEAAKAIYDGVKGWFTDLKDTVWGVIKGMVNAVIGLFNSMINRLNRLSISIPDWVPVWGGRNFSPNIPNIPELARGGDIQQAGWAMVGERGPEMLHLPEGARVTPLDRAGGQEVRHSGTIRVEGINDAGQLVAVKEIILNELYKEVRGR